MLSVFSVISRQGDARAWSWRSTAALAAMLALARPGLAGQDTIANNEFQLRFSDQGLTSLKHTADVHDTDYIAADAALGRLIVRYRTTRNGTWRELRDVIRDGRDAQSVSYRLAAPVPTLAARSSGSAVTGAAGLRGLNDGLVPLPPGGGPAPRTGGPASGGPLTALPQDVPIFTWSSARGPTQWVQYTFPDDEEVSRSEVFWTTPPTSWRLLYADHGRWREVEIHGPYGTSAHAFNRIEFAPVRTMAMRIEVTIPNDSTVGVAEWRVGPDARLAAPSDLLVRETFTLQADVLDWTITLANATSRSIEIGDLAVPFTMAERTGPRTEIYTRKLLRHAFVAGHGSWVFWERSNGVGPYLVAIPQDDAKFEYYDSAGGMFTPYIHARTAVTAVRGAGGNWRLPVSSLTLAPVGSAGERVTYRVQFRWAPDFRGVRELLVRERKFDIVVVPGMVIPSDLPASISLRSAHRIVAVEPEYPNDTMIDRSRSASAIFTVKFSRLGENLLTVRYGDGHWMTLEFFVTEPLETVIRKRAAFLVSHHQHADTTKWYYGAYGDWDQKNEARRSPDDRDGLSTWLTDANDDAGNARPAFIASKNVFFPDEAEIASVETYIRQYLWRGMQRTEEEKYPYGIYGIPNWKANRASPDEGRNGQAHLWRIYDYPHIVMLYLRMYQIAKFYPHLVKYLDAAGYLERAYRTALAYWTVPKEIENWSADAVGTMNEAVIPELIDALAAEGKNDWAATLRGSWEGKVERFINRTPNLYGSEFAFDSTGFESTGAFARYAITHPISNVTREAALKFRDFQLHLNMSDRGWLETTYYQLGSDYRGNLSYLLSYMSQMGGWSILDHGLYFADDPTDYLRLGYASSLSSWALVNSGTEANGYGYWFPSRNNDGATGGGFMPEALGRAWIGKQMTRGAWYYSAEADVGYCGALRTHATIVARDPLFGDIAYGGVLTRDGNTLRVIPRDGLRVRLHVVRGDERLHLELDHDGYAKESPIVVADDLSRIEFTVESRGGGPHRAGLSIAGLPAGEYGVTVEGQRVGTVQGKHEAQVVPIPIGSRADARVTIARSR